MKLHRCAVTATLILAALAALPALTPAAFGQPTVVEEPTLRLKVQPLFVSEEQMSVLETQELDVDPEKGSSLELELDWPVPGSSTKLRLNAKGQPGPVEGVHELSLEAELELPDGRKHRAKRDLSLREGATSLFEVFREGSSRLTLALEVERKEWRIAESPPEVGEAVGFVLEVQGVCGEQVATLETNELNTFIGERIEYSFKRGEEDDEESVQLRLTPVRREGDVVEITVEVMGSLPGDDGRLLLSRSETLFTSRGASSTFEVTHGIPPAGYRFLITPQF